MTIHTQLPEVKEIARKAFPSYSGRAFRVAPFQGPGVLTSYWDGGSRDYWVFVNLVNDRTFMVPENGTPFVRGGRTFKCGRLPMNVALVNHHHGRSESITIFVHPDNLNRLALPPSETLTDEEFIVLVATRNLKSSYAGIKNYRYHEAHERTGILEQDWNVAKVALITRGLLNKAGAITDAGRNAMPFEKCSGLMDVNRHLKDPKYARKPISLY